jgi:peptidoglycan hydrolase-like protein with peptidoglycan-binding domain
VRRTRTSLALALTALLVTVPAFATRAHRTTATTHARGGHKLALKSKANSAKSHKLHGQQVIDSARVTQIQQALIREHYMTGEANGQWDSTTQAAMQKFQSDQGWQTRLLPDSRAIKKLGLGPDYSGALNAKDSSFAPPAPANPIPADQASGFAAAAGVNR